MIGNGLTDPLIQMPSIVDFACDSPVAILDPKGLQCNLMRIDAPVCKRLIEACYKFDSRVTCVPAALHCWNLFAPVTGAVNNF
jgi:carboxypeptidase C (cathepsin A)